MSGLTGAPWRRGPAAPPGRPRVLLLHGLGCKTTMWDGFAALLGDSFELWDVELPWHGMAAGQWCHHEDPAHAIVDVLSTPDTARFDAVVAHSFAASLLIEAFADGRAAPLPAVLVSAFHRAGAKEFDWPTISRYLNDFHLIFAEALRLDDGERDERQRLWAAKCLRDQLGPYAWMRFFQCYLRSPFLDLSGVDAPALVVTGDRDLAARTSDGATLAAGLPDARFEPIAECGHFPMLERPERLARLVAGFLDTVRS